MLELGIISTLMSALFGPMLVGLLFLILLAILWPKAVKITLGGLVVLAIAFFTLDPQSVMTPAAIEQPAQIAPPVERLEKFAEEQPEIIKPSTERLTSKQAEKLVCLGDANSRELAQRHILVTPC